MTLKQHLQLQLLVIIASFTSIIGKMITIEAANLVFWRTLLAAFLLLPIFYYKNKKIAFLPPRKILITALINGSILGLHWLTFFWSIQLANISVCLIGMATTSFFTAFTEAIYERRWPVRTELLLGTAIVPAMILIAGSIDEQHWAGLLCACCSALLAATFPLASKSMVSKGHAPSMIAFWQLLAASFACMIAAYLFFQTPTHSALPTPSDWFYIFILAAVCTSFAFSFHIFLLKHISAFSVNLAINFEPIYGILLAALIFAEHQETSPTVFVGLAVIMAVNLLHHFSSRRA